MVVMVDDKNKWVLGIVFGHERGIHPYGIMKELNGQEQMSIATIYKICSRLEKEGYIQMTDGKSVVNGRLRKCYTATGKGKQEMQKLNRKVKTDSRRGYSG
ncbi:MAG: helix-turn-helix transcriptional regulator [Lachnospiraceae bacterium]|nr:helix-turn-helix transcriptional regulator [Lachnospiraceae bacterium]